MTPLDRLRDRYHYDAPFSHVVDFLRGAIHQCHLAPSEVRDAAFLASIMHEERRTRIIVVEPSGALRYPTEEEEKRFTPPPFDTFMPRPSSVAPSPKKETP